VRRKILQNYANVLCQHFIDLGSGADAGTLAELGAGQYRLDILDGVCTKDGDEISELSVCRHFREWLLEQLKKHQVPPGVEAAVLEVDIGVSNVTVKESYGHVFGAAEFTYVCRSEIRTDEKTYAGMISGSKRWGFMPSTLSRHRG
jgi:hypothetical protein